MWGYFPSYGYKGPTREVSDIFRQHADALYDQRRKTNQAIDDWSNGLMKQIKDHVSEQKRLLDQAYTNQEKYLNEMRDQFLASAVYEVKDDTKEIDRLLEKCKRLDVELANLNFSPRKIDFIEVIPVKPPEQMTQEESNRGDKVENRPLQINETKITNDRDSNLNSSSRSDRANPPSTIQSRNAYSRSPSINDNNNPTNDTIRDGYSNEKCPICYMIYPSYMSEVDRSIHVDDHYRKD